MNVPAIGQDPWGEDLNAYLHELESRLTSAESRIGSIEVKGEYVYNSYAWTFSNSPPPATGSQIRLNNTDPTMATVIDMRRLDSDSGDRTPVFQMLTSGDKIRINDWNDASKIHKYDVVATPTMDATNVQIQVVWRSGSGIIPNAKANVAFLVSIPL